MGDLKKNSHLQKIGRRTGVNIVEGKNIRKEEDGTDVFADYWFESDSDLEQSHSSKSNNSGCKTIGSVSTVRNIKAKKDKIANINDYASKFSNQALKGRNVDSSKSNAGSTDDRRKFQNIGRRTGVNVIAGKEIKKNDGIDVFENYWTDTSSELDSIHSRKSNNLSVTNRRSKASTSVKSKVDYQTESESNQMCSSTLRTLHNSGLSKPNADRDLDDTPPRILQKRHNTVISQTVRKKLSFERSRSVQHNADRSLSTVHGRSEQNDAARFSRSSENAEFRIDVGEKSLQDKSSNTSNRNFGRVYEDRDSDTSTATPKKSILKMSRHSQSLGTHGKGVQNKANTSPYLSRKRRNEILDTSSDANAELENVENGLSSTRKQRRADGRFSRMLSFSPDKTFQSIGVNTSRHYSKVPKDIASDSRADQEPVNNGRLMSPRNESVMATLNISLRSSQSKDFESTAGPNYENLNEENQVFGSDGTVNGSLSTERRRVLRKQHRPTSKDLNKLRIPKMKSNLYSKNSNEKSQPFEDNVADFDKAEEIARSNKTRSPEKRLNRSLTSTENKDNHTSKKVSAFENVTTQLDDVGTDFEQVATGIDEVASDFDDAEEIEGHMSNRNKNPKETVNMSLHKSKDDYTLKNLNLENQMVKDADNDSDKANEIEKTKSNKNSKRKVSRSLQCTSDIDTDSSLQNRNTDLNEAEKLVGSKLKKNRNSKGRVDMSLMNTKTKGHTSRNLDERNQIFEDDANAFDEAEIFLRNSTKKINLSSNILIENSQKFKDTAADFDDTEEIEGNGSNKSISSRRKVNSSLKTTKDIDNQVSKTFTERNLPVEDIATDFDDAEELEGNISKKNISSKGKVNSSLRTTKDKDNQASKIFMERSLPFEDIATDFDKAEETVGNRSNTNRRSKESVDSSLVNQNTYIHLKGTSLASKNLDGRNQIFEDSASDFDDAAEIEVNESNRSKNHKEKVNRLLETPEKENEITLLGSSPEKRKLDDSNQPNKKHRSESEGAHSPRHAASDLSYSPEKQKSNSGKEKRKQQKKPTKQKATRDPTFQPRRSSRDRVPPLAIWRNERRMFRYCGETGTLINLGIDPGTKEDTIAQNIPKKHLAKKQSKRTTDAPIVTNILDPRTGEVGLNLYRSFDANNFISPKNADIRKALYSVAKSHASKVISFGFLNISVEKEQHYSPTDNIYFLLLRGNVVAKIHKTILTPNKYGSFIVPHGVAYSIKNTGTFNALLSFCSFRVPMFDIQE